MVDSSNTGGTLVFNLKSRWLSYLPRQYHGSLLSDLMLQYKSVYAVVAYYVSRGIGQGIIAFRDLRLCHCTNPVSLQPKL